MAQKTLPDFEELQRGTRTSMATVTLWCDCCHRATNIITENVATGAYSANYKEQTMSFNSFVHVDLKETEWRLDGTRILCPWCQEVADEHPYMLSGDDLDTIRGLVSFYDSYSPSGEYDFGPLLEKLELT